MLTTRPRLYWTLQLIGWTLYGIAGVLLFAISGHYSRTMLVVEAIVAGTLLLLSHLLRLYVRRHGWAQLPLAALLPRLLAAHIGIALGSQVIIGALVALFLLVVQPPEAKQPHQWVQYLGYALNVFFVMWLWSTIYFGLHYLDNYRQADIDKWKLAATVREAEMRTLKAQINPHFMFNGLNNIRALVMEDPARARLMITHLADLLRYSIQLNSTEQVPLARELEIVRYYLELEAVQLEERLTYTLDVAPEVLTAQIPPMTLQLLVENAIKHGIAPRPAGGHISLVATPDAAGALCVTVRNTGQFRPMPDASGIGLRNVRERLHLLFGPHASLAIADDANQPATVVASLRLPLVAPPTPKVASFASTTPIAG